MKIVTFDEEQRAHEHRNEEWRKDELIGRQALQGPGDGGCGHGAGKKPVPKRGIERCDAFEDRLPMLGMPTRTNTEPISPFTLSLSSHPPSGQNPKINRKIHTRYCTLPDVERGRHEAKAEEGKAAQAAEIKLRGGPLRKLRDRVSRPRDDP